MDICQDEGCPNYVIDEPNKCITFKQASECPTPDYLNSKTEPVAEVPCSDGVMRDADRIKELERLLWQALNSLESNVGKQDFFVDYDGVEKLKEEIEKTLNA